MKSKHLLVASHLKTAIHVRGIIFVKTKSMIHQQELLIKMALDAWNTYITRADKLFNELSDEQLQDEVSPGRNSGIYLLGHLTAIHDALFPLLGLGEKLHPQLEEIFVKNSDKSGIEKPLIKEMREYWSEINNKLSQRFNELAADDWFQKHNAVSEEDFAKEPHRNKLNIILNRTNHLAYHLGQLAFLKK